MSNSLEAEQKATRVAFLVAGTAMSSWAPLIPFAKIRLGMDDGHFGLVLLCLGLGSILAMPLSGILAARFGCRRVILICALVALLALPILAIAPTVQALVMALIAFGAGVGSVDVVMNIQAVIVEKASGRAMMSGFHGLYSVGSIVGAGSMIGLLSLGASPPIAASVIAFVLFALLMSFRHGLLQVGSDEKASLLAIPHGSVLFLGALCLLAFLSEGSVLDWSGIFLNTMRGMNPATAGVGFVAFAASMTTGRLAGDAIVGVLGPLRTLIFGGLIAAAGYGLVVLVPSQIVTVLGFGLVGLGGSNLVPVLFSAAGRQKAMPTSLAIAAVTTMGYMGFLAGPALIGFAAHQAGLKVALAGVAALLILITLGARAATDTAHSNEDLGAV